MKMKLYLSLLMILFGIISSCADTIIVDGLERSYIVHLPSGFDITKQSPLVLALHGGGGTAKGMNKLTDFNKCSDKNNFIVVYPDGIDKQWNDGRNDFHLNNKIDDVKFISCLIDTLKKLYNADSNRVYATGMSNGAIMSFRLACQLSDKIAACAPVAGSMPEIPSYDCNALRPVPMMIIFGEDDPIVPYEGGEISLLGLSKRGKVVPVSQSVNFWMNFDGCNSTPGITEINKLDDDTKINKKVYSGGKDNSEVVFILVEGGGHCWPGGLAYLPKAIIGITSKEISATDEIWKFFEDKTLAK